MQGFQTGNIARAVVTAGKKQGTYVGRVLVRSTGSFDLSTKQGRIAGLNVRFFTHVHHSDGYGYTNHSDGYGYTKGSGHSSPA